MGFKETMYDLLLRSVITRFVLALIFAVTCCYLWAIGRVVPGELLVLTTSIVTYFFGTVSQTATQAAIAKAAATAADTPAAAKVGG